MKQRLRGLLAGGSAGNEQLTAVTAVLLLVLLAIEGATLLQLGSLLTVHAFVGMLLIPPVALKVASTGWRMVRYYRRGEEYVPRGPPHVVLRVLVSPVLVSATVALFATGVVLLVRGQTHGAVVGLHKAAFVVWLGAAGVHVLVHLLELPRRLLRRVPGTALRAALVVLPTEVVNAADRWPVSERAVRPSRVVVVEPVWQRHVALSM
jgi:hypothetical protein